MRGLAEALFSASSAARNGADDLRWAQQRVLDAVNEAEEAGFAVGEDLSVRYRGWMIGTDAEIAARQAQAEEFASDIQSRAAVLMAIDRELAAKINSAIAPLDNVRFDDGPNNGSVHAVDYRRTPTPRDNPDGDEDPFVPGGHTHEPQPVQSAPTPFDPETGAAEGGGEISPDEALVEALPSAPLANFDRAVIAPDKFENFSMDPGNSQNGGKWKAWQDLGFDISDNAGRQAATQDVIAQLQSDIARSPAELTRTSTYGDRYTVQSIINGPNGHGTLITIWQMENGIPRLITNWLKAWK